MSEPREEPLLRVLGPLQLHGDGVSAGVGGPVVRRLLAALVADRGRVVHLDRLMDVMWGPDLPNAAVPTLRSHVSRLRARLPATIVLEAVPPGYRLVIPRGELDVDRFEAALAAGARQLTRDPDGALQELDTALGMWRGPFLLEFADEEWALPEAVRLGERHLEARELRIEALLLAGLADRAVLDGRVFVSAHPEREGAWRLLVRALHASGREREALACAHDYRRRLRDESGLSPSAAFQAIERDIAIGPADRGRSGDAPALVTTPRSVSRRDSDGGERRTVPEPLTRFYGRHAEAERVAALLRTERSVTLLGAGGMGKTRLALHAAATVEFPGGTWFSALAEVADGGSDSVPYAVAESLGIRPERGVAVADTVAEWIGSRRALLVLDNCEHVRLGVVELVSRLLGHCRNLTVLATSRDPLHLPGETRLVVGPLDQVAARALFADRVHAYDPSAPGTLDLDDVADLCDRLGNIPLAVELAAARCRVTSPRELAARLDQRPELLSDTSRPPAQRGLTAVLDWSVDRLPPPARTVFAELSVFHGGCRLDEVEAIVRSDRLDGTDVLDAMEHLVDAGLVDVARSSGSVRYLQLEPIRQHGERMLSPSERSELAARHGIAFAELARRTGEGLCGPEYAYWIRIPEGDMANFRAAYEWAVRSGRIEVAVTIVAGLRGYLNERLTTEICDWGDAVVELTRGRGDALEATAVAAAATGWLFQRRYEEIYAASEWMNGLRSVDPDSLALVAWADGWARVNSGDHSGAAPIWEAALTARPSPWYQALLSASLVICGRQPPDLHDLLRSAASPRLDLWYRIWAVKIFGPPERLAAADGGLVSVIDQTGRLGATHARGVALYVRAVVLAQMPDRPLAEVLAVIDEAISLWSDLSVPSQMLIPILEALGFTLALRGLPDDAYTLFTVVEERGGTLWRSFRAPVGDALDALPASRKRASRQRAAQFANLAEVAQFARSLIRTLSRPATPSSCPGP